MVEGPIDLGRARVLVTNDDGIHAPGLQVLTEIAEALASEVWVVAPETEQSGTSHSLTLGRALRTRQHGPRRFSVDGTPTDCVLVAHRHIMVRHPPDLVLSGINHGGNLGEDVTYSGTVAAAMEAAILGLPAVALSQKRQGDDPIDWDTAKRFAPEILRTLGSMSWSHDLIMNVNFPPVAPEAVTGIRPCRQGRRNQGIPITEAVDPGGRPYLWVGNFQSDANSDRKTDLAVILDRAIAVTPLHLDLTHEASLEPLSRLFP